MTEFIFSGHAFDLVIGLLVLEGVLFSLYRRRTGRGIDPLDLWPSLAAGAGLLLAARALLVDAGAVWVVLALLLALTAHASDLKRRWRS